MPIANQNPIKDNKNGGNNTCLILVIISIVLLLLFVCCIVIFVTPFLSAMSDAKKTNDLFSSTSKTTQTKLSSTTTSQEKVNRLFNVGEVVTVDKMFTVTVNSVDNTYKPADSFFGPAKDYKYISMEVTIENVSSKDAINYSPSDWKITDENSYESTTYSALEPKTPTLKTGRLGVGDKVKGWLSFEVKKDSKELYLQYLPYFAVYPVEFKVK